MPLVGNHAPLVKFQCPPIVLGPRVEYCPEWRAAPSEPADAGAGTCTSKDGKPCACGCAGAKCSCGTQSGVGLRSVGQSNVPLRRRNSPASTRPAPLPAAGGGGGPGSGYPFATRLKVTRGDPKGTSPCTMEVQPEGTEAPTFIGPLAPGEERREPCVMDCKDGVSVDENGHAIDNNPPDPNAPPGCSPEWEVDKDCNWVHTSHCPHPPGPSGPSVPQVTATDAMSTTGLTSTSGLVLVHPNGPEVPGGGTRPGGPGGGGGPSTKGQPGGGGGGTTGQPGGGPGGGGTVGQPGGGPGTSAGVPGPIVPPGARQVAKEVWTTAQPFLKEYHESITRAGLRKSGLKLECIDYVVQGNLWVDTGAFWGIFFGSLPFNDPRRHGDNNMLYGAIKDNEYRWRLITDWGTHGKGATCRAPCAWLIAKLRLLGEYLHTVQDLYAHSDYVERHGGVNPIRGRHRIEGYEDDAKLGDIPTWDMDSNRPESYRDYFSGAFDRSEVLRGASDPGNSTRHLAWNKDKPDSFRGSMKNRNKISNFDLAVDVATRHTEKVWKAFADSATPCAESLMERCCTWTIVKQE